jgi:tetratricopeptide (TPR) repeat protein
LGLIFLIYSNTFNASWHLDDYANITHDARIKIADLSIDTLWHATASFSERLRDARPLARLTFALNWYFGGDDPFGYHVVNVVIHFLTAFFLFLTVTRLLSAPNVKAGDDRQKFVIALLSAVLWAINPIQTQAVTYIVQRMASLSTLFYVLGLFLYIRGRTARVSSIKILFFAGCLLSFLGGLASKENAATFPLALLLVEFLFFQDISTKRSRWILICAVILTGLAILGLAVLLFFKGNPLGLLNYQLRYFSPAERLLTEPRIILLYLSQIFYPLPARLSIEHDIIVSTSIFSPWTTLPSILIIIGLSGLGLAAIRKQPIVSFAIFFFFLNHMIESSIIGLELVFEHRNYLPSLFLFFPIAVGIGWLLTYYQNKNRYIFLALIAGVAGIIIGWSMGTYVRNFAWATEKTLWEDAITKAPLSSRPWHNLAMTYYERTGQRTKAMVLYRKALTLENKNTYHKSVILSNMATNYYYRNDFENAVKYWRKSLDRNPRNSKTFYLLSLGLARLEKFDEASRHLDQLIARHPKNWDALNLKAVLLLKQMHYRQGLAYFRKCLQLRPMSQTTLVNIGAAYSLMQHFQRAELYFKTARLQRPQDKINLLWFIRNAALKGDLTAADRSIEKLLNSAPKNDVIIWLNRISQDWLYNDRLLVPELNQQIRDRINLKKFGES